MVVHQLKPDIHSLRGIDWDRRLFDELIPLPDGTSYNAYLIRGSEKTSLIDTSDPRTENELINDLKELNPEKIEYVISNHAEQDHSGTIPKVLELYPEAKVVASQKGKEFLMDLLLIPEDRFLVVGDGEKLSLGNKTLQFIMAPWVHWPETMLTYLHEDKILFPCDLFGSHLATSELYTRDECKVYSAAKRYYAEIMMPFKNSIANHMKKLENLDVDVIAPSHGPVYDKPEFILDAYRDWVSDNVKEEVIVAYVSMHGSIKRAVEYFVDALIKKGLNVKQFNLTETDIGELAMALVDASTLVLATPTVLVGPHPRAVYAAYLVNALRPKLKFVSLIGSYCWGGRMLENLKGMLSNLKAEFIEPVIMKGYPKDEDFKALERLANDIIIKHTEYTRMQR